MKIEKLTLKNLASIEGEYSINFLEEPLNSAGIFCISGDTGSGKTTLLEAITLALYARTPKFNSKIEVKETIYEDLKQNDIRNILRKGCKEGYSKIEFIGSDNKKYISKLLFRTNKNKKLITTLQFKCISKNEEFDKEGKSLQEINKLLEEISKAVGLTYEQFTKTIILPQNEFANFLKSDENVKADILEKLTNTEIYAKIGARIREKRKDILTSKDLKEQEIKDINILNDDEKETKEKQKSELENLIKENNNLIDKYNRKLKWKEDKDEIIEKLNNIRLEKEKNDIEKSNLEIIEKELEAITAIKNENIYNIYENIRELDKEIKKYSSDIEESKNKEQDYATEKEKLIKDIDNIEKEKENFKLLKEKCDNYFIEYKETVSKLEPLEKVYQQYLKEKNEDEQKYKTAKNEFDTINKDLLNLESNCKINEKIETQILKITKKKIDVNNISDIIKETNLKLIELENSIKENDNLIKNLDKLYNYKNDLNNYRNELDNKIKVLIQEKEEEIEKNNKVIKEYEKSCGIVIELREQLKSEDRCPVCGSLEHPYKVNAELLNKTNDLYEVTKNSYEKAKGIIEKLNEELIELEKDKEKYSADINQCKGLIEGTIDSTSVNNAMNIFIKDINEIIKDNIDILGIKNDIESYNSTNDKELIELNNIIKVLELKEKIFDKEQIKIEKEQHYNEAFESFQKKQDITDKKLCEINEIKNKKDKINESIQNLFSNEKINADIVKQVLEQKEDNTNNSYNNLKDKLNSNKISLSNEQSKQEQRKKDKSIKETDKQSKTIELETKINEYNNKYEIKINLDNIEDILNKYNSNWEKEAKDKIDTIKTKDTELEVKRKELEAKSKELEKGRNKLEEKETINSINNELKILQEEQNSIIQKVKSIDNHLYYNEQESKKLEGKKLEFDVVQEEYKKWEELDNLIGGDKEGKLFKKIAQVYTLEILINSTNAQLSKLSSRYKLKRYNDNKLEFNIIDNEMGDEIRPISSLSGGETFIVSLGLALGLSAMASDNLQINSMFIDEGFGSLDTNTLNDIILILEQLHNTGKKIGIISHLKEIKERINTQIHLKKEGSGKSSIEVIFS